MFLKEKKRMVKLLSVIFISLIIVGCNREENNERKALSHCADIKYINFMNKNTEFIIDIKKEIEFLEAILDREEAVQKWMKENNTTKDLNGPSKASAKFADLSDPINFKLYSLFNKVIADASSIQSLNEKTMDYKVEYKKKEYISYAEYHLECWNEYKRDNSYYSKEFIDKYLEWQKQDVSNLGKQSYDFLNGMLKATNNTSYSNEFRNHFTKLMAILPTRN